MDKETLLNLIAGVMCSICKANEEEKQNWRNEADALVSFYINKNGSFTINLLDSNPDSGTSLVDMIDFWQKERVIKDSDFPLRNAN